MNILKIVLYVVVLSLIGIGIFATAEYLKNSESVQLGITNCRELVEIIKIKLA